MHIKAAISQKTHLFVFFGHIGGGVAEFFVQYGDGRLLLGVGIGQVLADGVGVHAFGGQGLLQAQVAVAAGFAVELAAAFVAVVPSAVTVVGLAAALVAGPVGASDTLSAALPVAAGRCSFA